MSDRAFAQPAPPGPGEATAGVLNVDMGSSAGRIATRVTWADCIDETGIEDITITLWIKPPGLGEAYKKEKKRIPPPVILPSGNWVYEFTGLTTGDVVTEASINVMPKRPPNGPPDQLLRSIKFAEKLGLSVRIP